jgi:signal transduction histidine kinase
MDVFEALRQVPTFAQVPDEQLKWLEQHGICHSLKSGDVFFKPGEPIDRLIIILSGSINLKVEQSGQFKLVATLNKFDITGLLPYSRASEARGYGEAVSVTEVFTLSKDHFKEMIRNHEELTTSLVHFMSSRIRSFTRREQLDDKLLALGKLSAGLAHELNNPSAAVVRSAQALKHHLSSLPRSFKEIIKVQMTDGQVDRVNSILFSALETGIQSLPILERAKLEDEILDWLEDRNIEDADDLAENFVDFGFTSETLDEIAESVSVQDLVPVMQWINQMLSTERIVDEIEDASQRINDLVTSVKGYSHMDQSPEMKAADIHDGIDSTITMLSHKIRKAEVEVVREFDKNLPFVEQLPSALNQVWTNLIDNAIDAMKSSETKTLSIISKKKGNFAVVDICDSGSGIPENIQANIFDPFFTTKKVGEGTGLGLELVHGIVVNQHHGSIDFESKPGRTVFSVCIPIKQ